jgi:hypothetical protein
MTIESVAEVWKPIEGFEYEVSNHGRVRSLPRMVNCTFGHKMTAERILKPRNHNRGYSCVVLYRNNERRYALIHRLVLETFVGTDPAKPDVNHKDANRKNNHLSNLEWVTPKENTRHAMRLDRMGKGALNGSAKLNESDVLEIKRMAARGQAKASIARRFGVTPRNVRFILNGRTWTHVLNP